MGNRLQNNCSTQWKTISANTKKERGKIWNIFFFISQCFEKKFDRNIKSCTCNRITAQRIMTNISTFFFSFFLSHLKPFEINIGFVIASKNRQVKKKLILKNASKRDGRHLCALMFIETRSIGISMGFFFGWILWNR